MNVVYFRPKQATIQYPQRYGLGQLLGRRTEESPRSELVVGKAGKKLQTQGRRHSYRSREVIARIRFVDRITEWRHERDIKQFD